MKIKTVTAGNREDFDEGVNSLLGEGWQLHGQPNITSVAQQDTWDGKLRCWKETIYIQVLKKD
jgi:hypothetical protein